MMQVQISISRRYAPLWLVLPVLLAGCETVAVDPADAPPEPGVAEATRNGPPGAAEGTCWGKTVSPAVVQTVTKQVQVRPAKVNPDGTIGAPPKYRTETAQEIVSPRRDNWFETPCMEVLTPEFVSSLQRALFARGFYAGAINGVFDPATKAAVQAFQRAQGSDSPVLSIKAARQLGLIAVPRQPSD